MIKFIKTEEVLPLRNLVLRKGKLKDEECFFINDDAPDSFHLGYLLDGKLVCIATFHHQSHPDYPGDGYQLRGMATAFCQQGKGYGNQVLNFAIVYLRGAGAEYVWCNARKVAFKFYQSLGFEFISEEFEIPNIGPHKVMYLKIQ